MNNYIRKLLAAVVLTYSITPAWAQQSDVLLVGDPAPVLKYSKWLKGEPVSAYKKDRLYVVEFWATWCGPCIAAMPHLSELAKQYKDKATFIGMNVWEKIVDKPYEEALPSVTKFVTSLGDKMSYNVAVDNNNRDMATSWLAKAKAPGIPTTFVIMDGKIAWIGHPKQLDTILAQATTGRLDVASYRKAHEQSIAIAAKSAEAERQLLAPIESALKAKEYDKAFSLMDTAIAKNAMLKYTMNIRRFNIILDSIDEKKALAFAEDWSKKDGPQVLTYLAQSIVEKNGLSKDTYLYAVAAFQQFVKANPHPMVYDMMAKCYSKAGDYAKAVEAEKQAIEVGREGLKAGKWTGVIHDYTITGYEKTLQEYNDKAAPKG